MPIVSQEEIIQEELLATYELILKKRELVKAELTFLRSNFDRVCNDFSFDDVQEDDFFAETYDKMQSKYKEYEFYNYVIDFIYAFKDEQDQFPEYYEMYIALDKKMLEFARKEEYEQAAILKTWADKIRDVILNH